MNQDTRRTRRRIARRRLERLIRKRRERWFRRTSILLAVILFLSFIATYVSLRMHWAFPLWPYAERAEVLGSFGDSVGPFASVFSALALMLAIYATMSQREELALQREESQASRLEQEGQRRAMEAQLVALNMSAEAARLQAAAARVGAYAAVAPHLENFCAVALQTWAILDVALHQYMVGTFDQKVHAFESAIAVAIPISPMVLGADVRNQAEALCSALERSRDHIVQLIQWVKFPEGAPLEVVSQNKLREVEILLTRSFGDISEFRTFAADALNEQIQVRLASSDKP